MREYRIRQDRKMDASCLNFLMTDQEYAVVKRMETIPDRVTLEGRAAFALGIVTGDNKKWISPEKRPDNEMVLKGSDIQRFRYKPSGNYLTYRPEDFQQTAPEACYRAPEKLIYRFICSQLVVAYDDRQRLTLNSGNILIPRIPGMDMKYIMAILNSGPVQFYFQKKYRSVKVLRFHLEKIPIPAASGEVQEEILGLTGLIMNSRRREEALGIYEELDHKISDLYDLNPEEYAIIKKTMKGQRQWV